MEVMYRYGIENGTLECRKSNSQKVWYWVDRAEPCKVQRECVISKEVAVSLIKNHKEEWSKP